MKRVRKALPIEDAEIYREFKMLAKQKGFRLGYAGTLALKEWIERNKTPQEYTANKHDANSPDNTNNTSPSYERLDNAIKYAKELAKKYEKEKD